MFRRLAHTKMLFSLRLRECLETYEDFNEKAYKVECIVRIPNGIQLKHVYHFWKSVVLVYRKKREDS